MQVTQRLLARWYLVLLAAIIAVLVGGSTVAHFAHGTLKEKKTKYFVATAQLLVDSNPSTLIDVAPQSGQTNLASRAPLIATYANQPSVRDAIAKRVGIDPSKITLLTATSGKTSTANNSPGKEALGGGSDSVVLHAGGASPTIQISAQAKGLAKARALANATIVAVQHALAQLRATEPITSTTSTTTTTSSTRTTTPPAGGKTKGAKSVKHTNSAKTALAAKRAAAAQSKQSKQVRAIVLRRLGGVNAGVVVATPKKSTAIEIAIGVFIGLLILVLVLDKLLGGRRGTRAVVAKPPSASAE